MELKDFFTEHPRGALALSGGADSALLCWAAGRWGSGWQAFFVHSVFQPAFERSDARALAQQCGVPLTVLEADVLSLPAVAANPPDRCYHCKQAIFSAILEAAKAAGLPLVIDGTNASDDASDRPGMRALRELEVRSPLRECGLTKADVRRLSREAGLPTWDKPAYACLATRIPTGTPLRQDDLARVEQAEAALAALGLRDFRVRLRENGALVQVTVAQRDLARAIWRQIAAALEPLFGNAALDPQPRTPSD